MITKIMSDEIKQVFGAGQCQCVYGSLIGNILSSCGDPFGFAARFETTEILSMSNLFDMEQNCKSTCCSKTGTIGFMHGISNTGKPIRHSCIGQQHDNYIAVGYFSVIKKND